MAVGPVTGIALAIRVPIRVRAFDLDHQQAGAASKGGWWIDSSALLLVLGWAFEQVGTGQIPE